jgi:hypothetical protein
MRFWWIISLFTIKFSDPLQFLNGIEIMIFISMIVESIRRTLWSIIRVENEEFFYRCLAWNLASKYIKNKIILKLDADSVNIDSSWIKCLKIKKLILDGYYLVGMNFFLHLL